MSAITPIRVMDHYTVVEDRVIDDYKLSAYGLLCYMAIRRHVNADGVAWPSRARLAKVMRCSVRTVADALLELQEAGYLEVASGQGTGETNVYTLMSYRYEKQQESRQDVPGGCAPNAYPPRHHVPTEVSPVEVTPMKKDKPTPAAPAVKQPSLYTEVKNITEQRSGIWASGAKEGVCLAKLITWAKNNHNGGHEKFLRDFLDGAWALHERTVMGLTQREADYWASQPYTPSRLLCNAASVCAVLERLAAANVEPVGRERELLLMGIK